MCAPFANFKQNFYAFIRLLRDNTYCPEWDLSMNGSMATFYFWCKYWGNFFNHLGWTLPNLYFLKQTVTATVVVKYFTNAWPYISWKVNMVVIFSISWCLNFTHRYLLHLMVYKKFCWLMVHSNFSHKEKTVTDSSIRRFLK